MSTLICSRARPVRKHDAPQAKGRLAAVGQPRGDADQVLLGDADVEDALGEALLEARQLARAQGVVAQGHDAFVLVGQLQQGLGRRRRGSRAGRSWGLRQLGQGRLELAASLGTLWCQAALSRMNDTPCPLWVWAIRQLGRPPRRARRGRPRAGRRGRGRRPPAPPSRRPATCRPAAPAPSSPRSARQAGGRCGRW